MVVLSDFLERTEWVALDRLAGRHDVIAMQLSDPRERVLPPVGLVTLWDPESGDWLVADADDPALRAHFQAERHAFDEASRNALRRPWG